MVFVLFFHACQFFLEFVNLYLVSAVRLLFYFLLDGWMDGGRSKVMRIETGEKGVLALKRNGMELERLAVARRVLRLLMEIPFCFTLY